MAEPKPGWPGSIREINDLPEQQKCDIYQTLLPDWVFPMFHIDPGGFSLCKSAITRVRCPRGSNTVEISLYHQSGALDPALYLHMSDTFNAQLSVLLVVVNDPDSPRFDIDVDEQGRSTQLGTERRNIPEEIRAMKAGLAPGQIRRGLRIFRTAVPVFDQFVRNLGHDLYFIEPLFYHNAITFERYGFAYSRGKQKMLRINQGFQPGGEYHAHLNDENPFRPRDAWQTVTGRSWAIHDGILGEPFDGVQMYKRPDHESDVCTFPDARW